MAGEFRQRIDRTEGVHRGTLSFFVLSVLMGNINVNDWEIRDIV